MRQPTPQPTSGKPAPPQLHSTDSNSSAGSVSVRPPSQPSSHVSQELQQQQQPPPVYPSGYGNSQPLQATPSSSQEHLNPMMQQQGSSTPHANQMHQGCFPNQAQPGPVYPPRPYLQDRGYPGYHASAGGGPYPVTKTIAGDHYPGPQSYVGQKPYPDMSQRDGYMTSGKSSSCLGSTFNLVKLMEMLFTTFAEGFKHNVQSHYNVFIDQSTNYHVFHMLVLMVSILSRP